MPAEAAEATCVAAALDVAAAGVCQRRGMLGPFGRPPPRAFRRGAASMTGRRQALHGP